MVPAFIIPSSKSRSRAVGAIVEVMHRVETGARIMVRHTTYQGSHMDQNLIEAASLQLRGSVKEAMGKVTGNRAKQAEGAAERLAGMMQAKRAQAAAELQRRAKR